MTSPNRTTDFGHRIQQDCAILGLCLFAVGIGAAIVPIIWFAGLVQMAAASALFTLRLQVIVVRLLTLLR